VTNAFFLKDDAASKTPDPQAIKSIVSPWLNYQAKIADNVSANRF
jgi:hypothetical protein